MNKPTFAAIVVGFILGASVMFIIQGKIIDQLRRENELRVQEVDDLHNENQLLVARLQQSTPKEVIDKIMVEVQAPAGVSELDVTKFVKEQLQFLVGSELSALKRTPDLPIRLVDGRTFVADQEEYIIHVNYVVVSEKLYISVKASPKHSG